MSVLRPDGGGKPFQDPESLSPEVDAIPGGKRKTSHHSIEYWENQRRERARKEGGYARIPTELVMGQAYQSLTLAEKHILQLSFHELRFAPKKKDKMAAIPKEELYACSLGTLRRRGMFSLPTAWIQVNGIRSSSTIAKAKQRMVELGFWDVVRPGGWSDVPGEAPKLRHGVYRYSDRWRTYDAAALFGRRSPPKYEGPPAGECRYPNIKRFNERRKRDAS